MKIYEYRNQIENIDEEKYYLYLKEDRIRNIKDTINFMKRLAI